MTNNTENILNFLRELKYAYHLNEKIYTEGSCFRVFCMLKALFPEALPYYSDREGHWATMINGEYWDINGLIDSDYIVFKAFELVTSPITLASAYIPTYKGSCVSYSKYLKTV